MTSYEAMARAAECWARSCATDGSLRDHWVEAAETWEIVAEQAEAHELADQRCETCRWWHKDSYCLSGDGWCHERPRPMFDSITSRIQSWGPTYSGDDCRFWAPKPDEESKP